MKPSPIGAVGVSTVFESLRVPMSLVEFLPEAATAAHEALEAAHPWFERRLAHLKWSAISCEGSVQSAATRQRHDFLD
jgi:hypothetical protein